MASIKRNWLDRVWNFFCTLSIVGIWPQYIEPLLLRTTKLHLPILPANSKDIKILQFSDLHIHPHIPTFFLKKILRKIDQFSPDLIACCGDFLCHGTLQDKDRFEWFLQSIPTPPLGAYAVVGNHDFEKYIAINKQGIYDVSSPSKSDIGKVFKRFFSSTPSLTKKTSLEAKQQKINPELLEILHSQDNPFQLLVDETKQIPVEDSFFNICGIKDYMQGTYDVKKAFANYDTKYPGIILAHNPDCLHTLQHYPGDLILTGHTHGGQINLPWIWKKFTVLENPRFKKGLFHIGQKKLYVNRGVSGTTPFRLCNFPELLMLTLSHE